MIGSMTRRGHSELGAAVLGVVLILLFACAMFVLNASRAGIVAERTSANRRHAAEAFEAAEAGLQWTIAMLNEPAALTPACTPDATAAGASFRTRMLAVDAAASAIRPVAAPSGIHAACARPQGDPRWRCGCTLDGTRAVDGIAVTAGDPSRIAASFASRLSAGSAPGSLTIRSAGCSGATPSCDDPDHPSRRADSMARIAVDVAPLPALQARPAAPLVARGAIDIQGNAAALRTSDAGGLLAIAGGSIRIDDAVAMNGLPGTPIRAALLSNAGEFMHAGKLEAADAFLVRWLGMNPRRYFAQPGITRVACRTACTSADLAGAAADGHRQVLALDGSLVVDAPIDLGTPDRPVLVVVNGSLSVNAALRSSGVWVTRGARWMASAAQPSALKGALVSAEDIVAMGPVSFDFDPDVLEHVSLLVGPFVEIPGSWRDFDD